MADHEPVPHGEMYTISDVSALVGLTARQIRLLVTDDIVHPVRGERGRYLFSFADVTVVREVADLVRRGAPMDRVRAAVRQIRARGSAEVGLEGIRLDVNGRRVIAHTDTGSFEPESGQVVMAFDEVETPIGAPVVIPMPTDDPSGHSAVEWFGHGDRLEETDPSAAEAAYRRAIAIDPSFAEAHVNLGRLLHSAGAVHDALECYERALTLDPGDATTVFNIGVAHDDLRNDSAAIEAYSRAVEIAPRFADARYNLAAVYERTGQIAPALAELRAYRELIEGR
jgi:DNA-binding transcriptional MerR regulator